MYVWFFIMNVVRIHEDEAFLVWFLFTKILRPKPKLQIFCLPMLTSMSLLLSFLQVMVRESLMSRPIIQSNL